MKTTWTGDVAILGAGPAGTLLAARLAQANIKTALIERRPQGKAGAQWVNGVAAHFFDKARVDLPKPPELLGRDHPFVMLSPSGNKRINIDPNPILEVDMRLLGTRMLSQATEAGADLFFEHEVTHVHLDPKGRPTSLTARHKQQTITINAKLMVDASGLTGVIRREIPDMSWACPPPRPHDLCTAAQQVHRVTDRAAARAFLARHHTQPNHTLAWTSTEGGYSVLNVRIDEQLQHISILTGATVGRQGRSGKRMLEDFTKEHPWVGDKVFGGARAIPLRRPYTRLVAHGAALLGDAACQVYATHGSGIGIGLVAADMLAQVIIQARTARQDIGARSSLWPYAARFHKQWGGLLGAADLMRRFTQRQSKAQVEALFDLLPPSMVHAALASVVSTPKLRELPSMLGNALRHPRTVRRLLPVLLRLPLVAMVARTYPAQDHPHHEVDLYRYERRLQQLLDAN